MSIEEIPPASDNSAATANPGAAAPVAVRYLGDISVLNVRGALPTVAGPAREALLAQWAGCPAAVLCDLSHVRGPMETGPVALLASVGAQVRQWPGIPIGLICSDRSLRDGLSSALEGQYLAVADTRHKLWGDLIAGAMTATVRAVMAPEARSVRAARDLVAAACSDWGHSDQIPTATSVTSELVTNAVLHASTDLELSISRYGHRLRVAVRDHNSSPPELRPFEPEAPDGRGMLLVAAMCQSWGVVLTGGGKVVWAVLDS